MSNQLFFITKGEVSITIPSEVVSAEKNSSDSVIDAATLLLLRKKEISMGSNLCKEGYHFGEFAMLNKQGLRLEAATAITETEMYTISYSDLWNNVFSFIMLKDRRDIIVTLFTTVNMMIHTPCEDVFEDDDDSNMNGYESIKTLHKFAGIYYLINAHYRKQYFLVYIYMNCPKKVIIL